MIVAGSGWAYDLVVEDPSFNCIGYNEVSSASNSVKKFFGHADVAACTFIKDQMVHGCVEVAQKFKRLQDRRRAAPWYGLTFFMTSSCLKLMWQVCLQKKWILGTLAWMNTLLHRVTDWHGEKELLLIMLLLHLGHGRRRMVWLVTQRVRVVRPLYWVSCYGRSENGRSWLLKLQTVRVLRLLSCDRAMSHFLWKCGLAHCSLF